MGYNSKYTGAQIDALLDKINEGKTSTPRVAMTASTAELAPDTFYVWGMADSLDLTLADGDAAVMNKYLFQFRNPKDSMTMLTLPDDITWSEDTELDENGMPVMEATAFYRIEIIEGLASLKKWKLVYINFADAEVERVLMANGVGDGIGITKRDAAAVTSFGGTLFRNNTDVTSFNEIIHFKGLETIANGAFYQCVNLVIDTLDNPSLSYIGGGAFNGTKLRKISSLGESVIIDDPSNNTGGAFYGCSELTEIAPEAQQSLVYVGGQAFIGTALQGELALANVLTIESGAFKGLLGITAIAIGELCEYIGNGAFYQCSNAVIEDLDLPNLATLAGGAFNGTKLRKISSLGGVTSLPNNINNTGGVFANCTELTEIAQAVLDKLTYVAYAWDGCTNLSIDLILPSLTGTYTNGFNNCPIRRVLDLGKITAFFGGSALRYANMPFGNVCEVMILPDTVESIGRYAFNGSASLLALVVKPATPPTLNSLAFDRAKTTTYPIYVPDASVEAYKAATNWNTYASRIKGITELATDNSTLYAEIQQYL